MLALRDCTGLVVDAAARGATEAGACADAVELHARLQAQMRSQALPAPATDGALPAVAAARASVISLLRSTAELNGDELAAEFTLLHLLSHVRARPHGLAAPPIGDLPLNLILPSDSPRGGADPEAQPRLRLRPQGASARASGESQASARL